MKLKPEAQAEIILWDWLTTKSEGCKIYFNRKNILNMPVFKTVGSQKKPDLLIEKNTYYGKKYYAVEVKSSNTSKEILQASKIIDKYLEDYQDKKIKYQIDNNIIELSGFLIATDKSPLGHLFKYENWIDNSVLSDGESKYYASTKYKIIPSKEGSRTFEFVRILWQFYSKIRNNYDDKMDIGIIIGNTDNNYKPYMMITSFDKNKNRWSQRWWKL